MPRKPHGSAHLIGSAGADQVFLSPAARALGIRLETVSRKKIVGVLPVGPRHLNRTGRVNGGVLMAFADFLGAAGTVMNLPAGHSTTTLESKTNFFAAGEHGELKGVATPLHIGRTTNVWQTTIKNPDGRTVAIVTQTQMVLAPRAREGPAPPRTAAKRTK